MKRTFFTLLTILILTAGAWFGGRQLGWLPLEKAQPAAGTAPPAPIVPIQASADVIAAAHVAPIQHAKLSINSSGMVATVLVSEGEQVAVGQPLLRLDQALAKTAVSKAEADQQRAQANLEALLAGTRPEEIAAAQAAVAAAQARLDKLRNSTEAGDIAAAEAAVAGASAQLQKVQEGASAELIINAKADLANAEAELQRAQRAYDQISWRNDIGATQEAATLQKATNNVEGAQARYNELLRAASPADVNAANAQISQAQAQLQALKAARPADIAAAAAEVQNAQAQLDKLLAGATAPQIAAAEADLMAATAVLQQQLIALGNTELRAPFAGVVAAINIQPGEQATAGAPLLQLADTSKWQIETEDLTELQVVQLQPSSSATITFDALPGVKLTGLVKSIRPFGENSSGDIVYTVVLTPEQQEARLLWNMTAEVAFAPGSSVAQPIQQAVASR